MKPLPCLFSLSLMPLLYACAPQTISRPIKTAPTLAAQPEELPQASPDLPGATSPGSYGIATTSTNQPQQDFSQSSFIMTRWRVIAASVEDGNTMKATNGIEEIDVRLACIDAPDVREPLGEESRSTLVDLLKQTNYNVDLRITDTDTAGRQVAEVWVDLRLLQAEIARRGMAYTHEGLQQDCPTFQEVQLAEAQARNNQVGIWDGSHPLPSKRHQ